MNPKGMPCDFKIEDGVLIKYHGTDSNVVIPEGATSIGEKAFRRCKSLVNVTLPDSLTTSEFAAFIEYKSLTSIVVPNSVTSLSKDAFSGCKSLRRATLPARFKNEARLTFLKQCEVTWY